MKKTILSSDLEYASFILKKGGVIVFPTETVWGIGADSRNWTACKEIYQIKNRPRDNPLIVHIDSIDKIYQITNINSKYQNLIQNFTPGPISFVLSLKDKTIFSNGLDTICVRIPHHKKFRELLKLSNIPISAPSANISGKPSITSYKTAVEVFDGKVDFILEGEDSDIGVESTVLSLINDVSILRPGMITYDDLLPFLPELKEYTFFKDLTPISPGMKYRHYSPESEVLLLDKNTIPKDNSALIGFEELKIDYFIKVENNLDYMKNLYTFFIECDKRKISTAYCANPLKDKYESVLLNRILKAISK